MHATESGKARKHLEQYYTPEWPTRSLLDAEEFPGPILEPAAGDGGIAKVLIANGYDAWCCDIDPKHPDIAVRDFLAADYPTDWDGSIITNPPYARDGGLAVKFIDKALSMTERSGGKVAMLLRVDFDSGRSRRRLFAEHPAFHRQYVLTQRIRWANIDQSEEGPQKNHAWFVWDWSRPFRDPTKGYLP
jgi:hypothetical protein